MKVTVCFGPVRVVVPCGHGDMLVRDLMRQATLRYRKATGKSASSWLAVHSLQSQAGGGLFDPDDRVLDVADDREQIVANFEDEEGRHVPGAHHHLGVGERGDGASGGGSSVGSSSAGGNSPELFLPHPAHLHTVTDIEVTGEQIAAVGLTPLQVRRGSEPALNHIAPGPPPVPSTAASTVPDPTKRWSAAPLIDDDQQPTSVVARKVQHRKENTRQRRSSESGHLSPTWGEDDEGGGEGGKNGSAFSRFVRDSNRLSMQFLGEGSVNGVRWIEAAERAQEHVTSASRKEPLGANSSSPVQQISPGTRLLESDVDDDASVETTDYVVLRNEEGPLGIHVVPDYDRLGQDRGLLVQGIEPGGRIDQDGRLAFGDRIIEINDHNLLNMPFQTVQEIFRDSLRSPELRLRVIKSRGSSQTRRPPAPVFPRMQQPPSFQGQRAPSEDRDNVAMVEGEEKVPSVNTKVATVSPTKKVPSVHPASRNANILLTANTRKIGKKLEIELVKGPHGLGFSITTRDNPAGGNCPIYIKNILPKGAAVEDGRLRPGDRLLEVNNVAMTGKTQSEAVSILRNAPPGGKVLLVVSRQEKGDESPKLPRELTPASGETGSQDGQSATKQSEPPEKANDDGLIFPWKHREILTFDIPVHDTEKAGLGVSVKGKTTATPNGTMDLGIFVKSVINGGAASRDGRLRTNDQLLDINGVSLLGTSNSDAMETLRRGMHQEGPKPGVITIAIARRVFSTPGSQNASPHNMDGTTSGRDSANSLLSSSSGTETFGMRLEGEGPTPENSCASETSENTVIFLPKINGDAPYPSDYNRALDRRVINPLDPLSARNPVIERLTGQQYNALRNESYYKATNDSWSSSFSGSNFIDKCGTPTIRCPTGENIMIEEEYSPHQIIAPHPRRPDKLPMLHLDRNAQPPDGHSDQPMTPQSQISQEPSTPKNPNADITYASQTSLEEGADAAAFSRDAFGRQSMSEKRHAALDAKNTDTYQRNKKLREERERQRQMQAEQQNMNDRRREQHMNGHAESREAMRHPVPGALYRATSAESIISMTRSQAGSEIDGRKTELGPALGMKKSSSLESLQTMVQEIQMQEDGEVAYTYRGSQGPVKVIRGRGCNESFRAAVDRSYEAPLTDIRNRMETSASPREHCFFPPPWPAMMGVRERGIDAPPLFPPYAVSEEDIEVGHGGTNTGNFGRGTRQQSSLNSALDNKYSKKEAKKKAGLFRGIGSMFRFGKHRKTIENPLQSGKVLTEEEPEDIQVQQKEQERLAARQAQEEQQRIQEQYQRLVQRQRQTENQMNTVMTTHGHPDAYPIHGGYSSQQQQSQSRHQEAGGQSRTERIQQLRAQHQRRHAERMGQYPLDEREERYEQVIRQRLEQPHPQQQQQQPGLPQPPDVVHHHHRTASYDLYGEMARPGSRSAIADPNRYSHYVNYEEIQHHLSKGTEQLSEQQIIQMRQQVQQQRGKVEEESRRQQHYHSQRRDPREVPHQRPVSNYFEYESVQTVLRAGMPPPPHQVPLSQHFVRDSNANSLPRRGQERGPLNTHGSTPPRRQYPPSHIIINNNNEHKTGNYGRVPSHMHDTYVPVHSSRSSGRSNGSAFPHKMTTQPGSKV